MNTNVNVMMSNLSLPPRLLLGLCVGLSALTFITFGVTVWQWRLDWQLTHEASANAVVTAKIDETAAMIAAIPDAHLFGKNFSGGAVPITSLQLRVTGIVKSDTASKAYISVAGQPGKIFQIGDTLADGVKVYDITQDTVILENDSHLEKLPLPRESLQFKSRNTEEA